MSKEEKEEIIKNAIKLGELVGTYGNKKQIEIFEWFIDDWNTKTETAEKLQKENQELKEDNSHQWEERCRLTFELERLQKENEELKAINSMQKYRIEVIDERDYYEE